jgi:chromosome segregation ATPase
MWDANTSKATVTALQAEIAETNSSLLKAHAELEAMKQDLAHEKMEKASAQADLEAAKSKKPDTSEADALRKELQALKDQHQAALMSAQQESVKATEEHLATKASLEKLQTELARQKEESKSDYKSLHDSLGQLVEEATKKTVDVEARLKEAEANLKVKDAELAEVKVHSPSFD